MFHFQGKEFSSFSAFCAFKKFPRLKEMARNLAMQWGKCREYRWEKFEAIKGSVSVLFVLYTVVKLNSNRILRRTADDARYLLQRMPFFLATLSGWILLHR